MTGLLAACGGGSGGGGGAATGTVAVVFTDGPTDEFDQIIFEVSRMTLIGPGGHVALYDGPPITFDLLEMSEWADLAFTTKVLAGSYNKIRLEIASIEMIDLDDPNGSVMLDKLPANGKVDLNPQGPFEVSPDFTTVIKADIEANRSFQVVETGNGDYRFRPVVFVDVYQRDDLNLPDRLVRVFGTVEAGTIDDTGQSFDLCNLGFPSQLGDRSLSDPDACVRVYAAAASIFDAAGMHQDAGFGLVNAGEEFTAIGFIVASDDQDAVLGLNAVVLEQGGRRPDTNPGWDTLDGAITADSSADCPSATCYEFGDGGDTDFTVVVQPGTRVFRADGVELTQGDLDVDDAGSLDGYVDGDGDSDGTTEEVLASLFVLSNNDGRTEVSGALQGITLGMVTDAEPFPYYVFEVQNDLDGPEFVCADKDTDILQLLVDNDTVSIVDLLDPRGIDPDMNGGFNVEAFGEPEDPMRMRNDCTFDADQIVISKLMP